MEMMGIDSSSLQADSLPKCVGLVKDRQPIGTVLVKGVISRSGSALMTLSEVLLS